jgi:hypothetical protein
MNDNSDIASFLSAHGVSSRATRAYAAKSVLILRSSFSNEEGVTPERKLAISLLSFILITLTIHGE